WRHFLQVSADNDKVIIGILDHFFGTVSSIHIRDNQIRNLNLISLFDQSRLWISHHFPILILPKLIAHILLVRHFLRLIGRFILQFIDMFEYIRFSTFWCFHQFWNVISLLVWKKILEWKEVIGVDTNSKRAQDN